MTTEDYPNMDAPRKRRRVTVPSPYDLRDMARTLMFLAALAGMIMGEIWLAGKL